MTVMPAPMQRLNPFPFFAAMRRKKPVVHDELFDVWGVFRYDDVKHVLHDFASFGSDSQKLNRPPRESPILRPSLAGTDPPRHGKLRGLVAQAFTPASVARLEPGVLAAVNDALDRVADSTQMDVVDDLAEPVALRIIADMLGIPAADHPICRRWADSLHSMTGAFQFAAAERPILSRFADALHSTAEGLQFGEDISYVPLETQAEMDAYFRQLIVERRRSPKSDLISDLVAAQVDGEHLDVADLVSFCVLLLIAGHFNMVSFIANAFWTLLEHPAQLVEVQADPALSGSALEEVLRYRSVVMGLPRITLKDVEIGGQQIPAGERIVAWVASANRDEAYFPDPDRFDIHRKNTASLAFGHGVHTCMGPQMARLQGRLVLQATLARLTDLDFGPGELRAISHPILYRLQHLPMVYRSR